MSSFKWGKLLGLSWSERMVLIEAACALSGARLALLCISFRRIAAWFGCLGAESGNTVSSLHDAAARQVGWAVETMARQVPWESRCLAQAISAWWMLSRRGIAGTVYFGVVHDPGKRFGAHAWLRCGSRIVTGGPVHEQFRVLTSFARNAQ